MTRVAIIHKNWMDAVDIFIVSDGPDRHVMSFKEDGKTEWVPYEEFAEPPPTMTLRYDVWDAFQKAVGQHTQASDATVEALRDTRAVRDRLLALIEAGWER